MATPLSWVDDACSHLDVLLIDHANCEKKAASTALSLLYRYVEDTGLVLQLARLAREELRHFEQVVAVMRSRGVVYRQLTAGRYAQALHRHIAKREPQRLVDTLLVAAIVEARSCERFALLAEALPSELGRFYARLLASEMRHFEVYRSFARRYASDEEIASREADLLDVEALLITDADDEVRFHSGPLRSENTPK